MYCSILHASLTKVRWSCLYCLQNIIIVPDFLLLMNGSGFGFVWSVLFGLLFGLLFGFLFGLFGVSLVGVCFVDVFDVAWYVSHLIRLTGVAKVLIGRF